LGLNNNQSITHTDLVLEFSAVVYTECIELFLQNTT